MWFGVHTFKRSVQSSLYVYRNKHMKSTSSSFTIWTYRVSSFFSCCCVMCSQTAQRASYNTFHFLKTFSHASGCQTGTVKFLLTCGQSSLHPISSITSARRPLRLYICLWHPRGPKTPFGFETTDRVRLYCSSLSDMHGLLTTLNCHREKGREMEHSPFLN